MASEKEDAPTSIVEDFEQAIATFLATGHTVRLPYYLGLKAQCLAREGRLDEAETMARGALDRAEAKHETWCLPELLRIQAFVLTKQGRAEEAEGVLLRSMALAREIGALSWRLRSATDLAAVWLAGSRKQEARAMLAATRGEFTQGFETRDLVAADHLLARLEGP